MAETTSTTPKRKKRARRKRAKSDSKVETDLVQKIPAEEAGSAPEAAPADPDAAAPDDPSPSEAGAVATGIAENAPADAPASGGPVKKRGGRRRRSKRSKKTATESPAAEAKTESAAEPGEAPVEEKKTEAGSREAETGGKSAPEEKEAAAREERSEKTPRRRRRRRGRGGQKSAQGDSQKREDKSDTAAQEKSGGGPPSPRKIGASERVMLVNVAEGEETRIAVVHENRLEELFMERASSESHVGNIYKGIVTNVEPSIQAAFIDFGLPKHGFLHISDLQPQYFPEGKNQPELVGRKTPRRERPPIQKCLRRGQEVMVQIIKEGIGTKGPTLTTYLSIPGRYLVMMPGMNRLGVSRKIEDEDARRKMRKVLEELQPPPGMGYILRTAGLDKSKRELQRDLTYLQRLWKVVAQRVKNEKAPCELYQESDLVIRTIRDVYSSDFSRIIVDNEGCTEKVRDFLSIVMPRTSAPVEFYSGYEPIFHKYGIEEELERLYSRHVPLPSGGSLVIDTTEAMVAIDVNSGKFRDIDDAEQSALKINIEAAEEIARQLRLRDLGGLILCDFIDMRLDRNRRAVERSLREALKSHKERAKCLRTSQFGIIEITRQRMRPSLKRNIYTDCPHCRGAGLIKTTESMTLDVMRLLRLAAYHRHVVRIDIRVAAEVAYDLLNRKRTAIHHLEQETNSAITIRGDGGLSADQYRFECYDQRGSALRVIERKPEPGRTHERRPHDRGRRDRPVEEPSPFEEVFD